MKPVREWYRYDHSELWITQIQAIVRHFKSLYPDMAMVRFTVIEGEPWACFEGWKERPDDQGPVPTAEDIPVGFV